MPFKVTNPDAGDLNVTLHSAQGIELGKVEIPARGYAIVKSVEGIAGVYAQLEISPASDSDYEDYRKAVAKTEKEKEEAAKVAVKKAAKEAAEEAERVEKKIEARHKAEKEERKKALEVQLGIAKVEDETRESLEPKVAEQTKKKGKK